MPPPVISPLKRKSLGDLPDYGSKRRAIASPGDVSPRGFAPTPGYQQGPPAAANLVNIQPRPNGYVPPPPTPSSSASPYNPATTGRRRGRPPKSIQGTWQVATYPHITPAPATLSPATAAAPLPHSPVFHAHQTPQPSHQPAQQPPNQPPNQPSNQPSHQPTAQGLPESKPGKKALQEIVPRPAHGQPTVEPAVRSPATEYQSWRDETSRREYYQVQASEPPARERPASAYPPILPRPRSPLPSMRDLPRPASTEPRHFRATPPATAPEPARRETRSSATDSTKS